jgi:protein-S-isoprenylcysteine O-methyltransferase Ste14
MYGWIGSICLLAIIPVKVLRFLDGGPAGTLLVGLAPSVLGPGGLLFLILSGSGRLSRLPLFQLTALVAVVALGLEFAQLLPRPGILAAIHYTFDWLDVIVSLLSVSLAYGIAAHVTRNADSTDHSFGIAAMDILGKSPIAPPLLIIGKLALFACCLFPFASILQVGAPLHTSDLFITTGMVLLVGGLLLLILALSTLGRSVAVGIPERRTELRTRGLYSVSRNPVYLGAFMMCTGSCVMATYPVNFCLFVLAVVIHHRIIRKEEQFLEERFGEAWRDYRARVPRYIGRTGHGGKVGI